MDKKFFQIIVQKSFGLAVFWDFDHGYEEFNILIGCFLFSFYLTPEQ